MKSFDAAKLPVGFLVVAAMLQWAPQLVSPLALVAYAAGAYLASSLNLKGVGAAVAIVAGVVLFQVFVADTGVAPVRQAAEVVPGFDQLGQAVGR